jgi:hypothetical protein
MAGNTVYSESVVTLNASQAQATMTALQNQADVLRQKMIEATQIGDVESAKKYQKELDQVQKSMSSIKKETKDYREILNRLNGASMNELQKAAQGLNRELRKLKPGTDEFIQKSKELKQVRNRMKELNDETKQTQSLLSKIPPALKAWLGVATAVIGGLIKLGKDLIANTQQYGDVFEAEMAGIKAAYQSLIIDMANGTGWNELVQNMRSAYENGKLVTQMLDEIFERQNSLSMMEAEYNVEIERNKQLMRDQTLSDEERLAAAEEAVRLERELATEKRDVAQQEYDAYKLQLQTRTRMNDDELQFLVREYNANKDIIRQADEYNTELNKRKQLLAGYEAAGNYLAYGKEIEKARAEIKALEDDTDQSIKDVAAMVAKYNLSSDEMVSQYVKSYNSMLSAESNFYSATTRIATTASGLRKSLIEEHAKANDAAYKEEISAAEKHSTELLNIEKKRYIDGEITAETYEQRQKEIQRQGLQDKIDISKKYLKDSLAYQSQLLDMTLQEQMKLQEEADKVAAKETAKRLDEEAKALQKQIEEEAKENERLQKLAADLTGATRVVAFQAELADLETLIAQKLIDEEEYQKAKAEIIQRYQAEQREYDITAWKNSLNTAKKYLSQISTAMNNLQEAKMAQLEAQMNAELEAAGDNAERREQIEQEYEAQKLKVQQRYADVNMGIQIAQALANGASAILATYAQLGFTPAGIAASALMAVVTATEVAMLVAQRNAIRSASVQSSSGSSTPAPVAQRTVNGYSTGGYTERAGSDMQEVGVVHANEWVAPASMVRAHPVLFRSLESMRRKERVKSGMPGFADGGMAGEIDSDDVVVAKADLDLLTVAINRLLTTPIRAYVVNSEANAVQELNERIKSITSIK